MAEQEFRRAAAHGLIRSVEFLIRLKADLNATDRLRMPQSQEGWTFTLRRETFMNATIAAELQEWKAIFKEELRSQLEALRADHDIYGFAVEVPDDLGNLGIIAAIGRESKLIGEKPGSLVWLDRRYSAGEWEYLPNAIAYGRSCERLEEIGRQYKSVFITDSSEYTPEGVEFRDALYSACLDVMAECDAAGAFGSIWYKIITLSDDEHLILRESFQRLNRGRSLEEAARLYQGK